MSAVLIVLLAPLLTLSTVSSETDQGIVIQPDITSTENDEYILTAISFVHLGAVKQSVFQKGIAVNPVFSMQNSKNTTVGSLRVEYAIGHLSQKGSDRILQNCTGVRYNRTLAPLETLSMQYSFKPEPSLDLGVYHLALRVFYVTDQGETKMKTFDTEFTLIPAERFSRTTRYVFFAIIFIVGIFLIQWASKSEDGVDVLQAKKPENVSIDSWKEIPKEHLHYVQARRRLKPKKT